MNREEAIRWLKHCAFTECDQCEHYYSKPDEWCDYQLIKIAHLLEQEESHDIRTETHECVKETHDSDLISRADAIEAVIAHRHKAELSDYNFALGLAKDAIRHLPSAEAVHKPDYSYEADMVKRLRQAEAVQGEWEDREVFNETDDDHIVEEWQSARCSVCGKYHTTPYMYYFDDFNYCPNCGARMYKGGDDE